MNLLIHRNKLLTGDLAKIMTMLITHAKKSVYLTSYHIQNPSLSRCPKIHNIFLSLKDAQEHSIDVRVLLNYLPHSFPKYIHNLPAALWFVKQNIPVRYLPRATTLHAKLIIVDSLYMIIGSHNLTPTAFEKNVEASFLIVDSSLASSSSNWYIRYWDKSIDFTSDMV